MPEVAHPCPHVGICAPLASSSATQVFWKIEARVVGRGVAAAKVDIGDRRLGARDDLALSQVGACVRRVEDDDRPRAVVERHFIPLQHAPVAGEGVDERFRALDMVRLHRVQPDRPPVLLAWALPFRHLLEVAPGAKAIGTGRASQ
eukprot:2331896-Prymnesium_polylepis.2